MENNNELELEIEIIKPPKKDDSGYQKKIIIVENEDGTVDITIPTE